MDWYAEKRGSVLRGGLLTLPAWECGLPGRLRAGSPQKKNRQARCLRSQEKKKTAAKMAVLPGRG